MEQIYPPFPPNPDGRAAGLERSLRRLERRNPPAAAAGGSSFTWCYASKGFFAVAAGATTIIDVATSSFYTSSPTDFSTGTYLSGGITYHGLKILTEGHYLSLITYQPVYPGGSGKLSEIVVDWPGQIAPSALFGVPRAQQLTATVADQLGVTAFDVFTTTPAPTSTIGFHVTNSSGATFNAAFGIVVIKLDTDTTGLL